VYNKYSVGAMMITMGSEIGMGLEIEGLGSESGLQAGCKSKSLGQFRHDREIIISVINC
jgi:hypothetical protein